jgi:hypothetical protein
LLSTSQNDSPHLNTAIEIGRMAHANSEKLLQKILILVAMEGERKLLAFILHNSSFLTSELIIYILAEAAPMIAEFGLIKQPNPDQISRMELFTGEHSGCSISLITNGKCSVYGCDEVGRSIHVISR